MLPTVTSDGNTYIACWANKTGSDEVMFRASTNNDATFSKKINLSTTNGQSIDTMINAAGNTVIGTSWESKTTADKLHSELRILDWIFFQVCSNEIKKLERL